MSRLCPFLAIATSLGLAAPLFAQSQAAPAIFPIGAQGPCPSAEAAPGKSAFAAWPLAFPAQPSVPALLRRAVSPTDAEPWLSPAHQSAKRRAAWRKDIPVCGIVSIDDPFLRSPASLPYPDWRGRDHLFVEPPNEGVVPVTFNIQFGGMYR